MKYSNDDFKVVPSYEKITGTPVFLPVSVKRYDTLLENVRYYTDEDFETVCKLISQLKFRAWTLPDLKTIKGGVIDKVNFSAWQKKSERSEDNIDTFVHYSTLINEEKIKDLWTTNKLKQPISVCCIALSGVGNAGQEVSGNVISAIESEIKNSKLGEIADVVVGNEIISSLDFYNNLDKHEKRAYDAFKIDGSTKTSDYMRHSHYFMSEDEFFVIPVYVRCKHPGVIFSDIFFSTRSVFTKINTEKIEKALSKKMSGEVAWDYCFPAEAIPEVGRLIKLKSNELTKMKNNIKILCQDLAELDGSIYIDLAARGSKESIITVDRISEDDTSFYGRLAKAMYETLYDGGGYCYIINDVPGKGITVCGLAFDCIDRWKGVPVDFLKETYKVPVLQDRVFSQYDMDYVDFVKICNGEYEKF